MEHVLEEYLRGNEREPLVQMKGHTEGSNKLIVHKRIGSCDC